MVDTKLRPAVFLDRDGVLIKAFTVDGLPMSANSIQEMEVIDGVPEALLALRAAGFLLIVVTNQPDVARGKIRRDTVEAMHQQLLRELPLDEIFVCYHSDSDQCQCRKPKPGLIFNAAQSWSIDLKRSYVVGDRWKDVDAGEAAGCRTVFVDYGYREPLHARPGMVVFSLREASWKILGDN